MIKRIPKIKKYNDIGKKYIINNYISKNIYIMLFFRNHQFQERVKISVGYQKVEQIITLTICYEPSARR